MDSARRPGALALGKAKVKSPTALATPKAPLKPAFAESSSYDEHDFMCFVRFDSCRHLAQTFHSKAHICARIVKLSVNLPPVPKVHKSVISRLLRRSKSLAFSPEWRRSQPGTSGPNPNFENKGKGLAVCGSEWEAEEDPDELYAIQVALNSGDQMLWGDKCVLISSLPNDIWTTFECNLIPEPSIEHVAFNILHLINGTGLVCTNQSFNGVEAPRVKISLAAGHGVGCSAFAVLRGYCLAEKEKIVSEESDQRSNIATLFCDQAALEQSVVGMVYNVTGLAGDGEGAVAYITASIDPPLVLPTGEPHVLRLCRVPILNSVADWVTPAAVQREDPLATTAADELRIPILFGRAVVLNVTVIYPNPTSSSYEDKRVHSTVLARSFSSLFAYRSMSTSQLIKGQAPSRDYYFEIPTRKLSCDEDVLSSIPGGQEECTEISTVSAYSFDTQEREKVFLTISMRAVGFGIPTASLKRTSIDEVAERAKLIDEQLQSFNTICTTIQKTLLTLQLPAATFAPLGEALRHARAAVERDEDAGRSALGKMGCELNRLCKVFEEELARKLIEATERFFKEELVGRSDVERTCIESYLALRSCATEEHSRTARLDRVRNDMFKEYRSIWHTELGAQAAQFRKEKLTIDRAMVHDREKSARRQIVSSWNRSVAKFHEDLETFRRTTTERSLSAALHQLRMAFAIHLEELNARARLSVREGLEFAFISLMVAEGRRRRQLVAECRKATRALRSGAAGVIAFLRKESADRLRIANMEEKEWALIKEIDQKERRRSKSAPRCSNPPWIPSGGNPYGPKTSYAHSSCVLISSPLSLDSSQSFSRSLSDSVTSTRLSVVDELMERVKAPTEKEVEFHETFYYGPLKGREQSLAKLRKAHRASPVQSPLMVEGEIALNADRLSRRSCILKAEKMDRLVSQYVRDVPKRQLTPVQHRDNVNRLYYQEMERQKVTAAELTRSLSRSSSRPQTRSSPRSSSRGSHSESMRSKSQTPQPLISLRPVAADTLPEVGSVVTVLPLIAGMGSGDQEYSQDFESSYEEEFDPVSD